MLNLDTLVVGDCIEQLRLLPDRSIDLVILDPPYWKVVGQRWDFQWRTVEDYAAWASVWIDEIARVIRHSGSVYLFGYTRNLVHLFAHFERNGFLLRQDIVIDKGLASIAGRKTSSYKTFPTVTENVWFFVQDARPFVRELLSRRARELGLSAAQINRALGAKTGGGGVWSLYAGRNVMAQLPTRDMWSRLVEVLQLDVSYDEIAPTFNIEMGHSNVWSDISFRTPGRIHPTQKPEAVVERIIRASTDTGMVVLDPFFGSGTTGVVAQRMGRHWIGFERDAAIAASARQRIQRTT